MLVLVNNKILSTISKDLFEGMIPDDLPFTHNGEKKYLIQAAMDVCNELIVFMPSIFFALNNSKTLNGSVKAPLDNLLNYIDAILEISNQMGYASVNSVFNVQSIAVPFIDSETSNNRVKFHNTFFILSSFLHVLTFLLDIQLLIHKKLNIFHPFIQNSKFFETIAEVNKHIFLKDLQKKIPFISYIISIMGHFMKSPVSNEVFEFVFSRLLKMNLKSVDFYKDWIVHFLESTGFKIDQLSKFINCEDVSCTDHLFSFGSIRSDSFHLKKIHSYLNKLNNDPVKFLEEDITMFLSLMHEYRLLLIIAYLKFPEAVKKNVLKKILNLFYNYIMHIKIYL